MTFRVWSREVAGNRDQSVPSGPHSPSGYIIGDLGEHVQNVRVEEDIDCLRLDKKKWEDVAIDPGVRPRYIQSLASFIF